MSSCVLGVHARLRRAGALRNGLALHPDDRHILYALGSSIVIRELGVSKEHEFMQGHTETVTCLVVSKSGRLVASGQRRLMSQKADVCVWDFASRTLLHRFVLHKADIADLAFSPNEAYLASLGGEDDNALVIWDLARGEALCGSPASMGSSGFTYCVRFFHNDDLRLVSGGQQTLRVWQLDPRTRKVRAEECRLGQLKRVVESLELDEADDVLYCGTTTGDVLHVNLSTLLFQASGPKKPLPLGVTALARTRTTLVVGSGEGKLVLLQKATFKVLGLTELAGAVTSIALDRAQRYAFVGTAESNIYYVDLSTMEAELRASCHSSAVLDVAFPHGFSEVFATCGENDIRIWHARKSLELVRIQVPNVTCLCIAFTRDGGAIMSGWNDGKLRAFGPETGTLLFAINSAHQEQVTALACSSDSTRVVSGGADGQVRVWQLLRESQVMQAALKEHRGRVTSIQMRANDLECVSSSVDGSCILWDLKRMIRLQVMFAPSLFKCVRFHPDESQVVTCGTDRKIAFWDTYDGTVIREIELPSDAHINSLALCADGERFATAGDDRVVQLWAYDAGEATHISRRVTGSITKIAISPDQQEVVAVTSDGAIFVWALPVQGLDAAAAAGAQAAEYF